MFLIFIRTKTELLSCYTRLDDIYFNENSFTLPAYVPFSSFYRAACTTKIRWRLVTVLQATT